MSRPVHIMDDVPLFPRRKLAPHVGADNRVGGRYLLPLDSEMKDHPEWSVREELLLDTYPCLQDDADSTLADTVDSAVAALPKELREAVELCVFANLSFREAGKELGVYHKTVARRLRKALVLLADDQQLQERVSE